MSAQLLLPRLSLRAFAVWRRDFLVWKKLAIPSLLGNLADPMIYLFGLGYGLGGLLPQVGGVSYIAFLAAGTVCASTMNAASLEALYSAFSRMHVQRTWEATGSGGLGRGTRRAQGLSRRDRPDRRGIGRGR